MTTPLDYEVHVRDPQTGAIQPVSVRLSDDEADDVRRNAHVHDEAGNGPLASRYAAARALAQLTEKRGFDVTVVTRAAV